jgi:hypothetical protein
MSTTGLPLFDDTVQQTNRWLNEIIDHVGDGTPGGGVDEALRKRAYNALRAVLLTLHNRLPTEFSAPMLEERALRTKTSFSAKRRFLGPKACDFARACLNL